MRYEKTRIKDFDAFKTKVDAKYQEARETIEGIKSHGADLRDKIFELNSLLPRYNELYDYCVLIHGIQKQKIDFISALAMKRLVEDAEFKHIQAILKKSYLEIVEVTVEEGYVTTLAEEKFVLQWHSYAVNKFSSAFELVKTTIMSCQSGLNFDKEEMKRLNYT